MKGATLFALIFSVLEMLVQVFFYLTTNFFRSFYFQLNLNQRALNIGVGALYLLFLASLSYFFLVLYKNQKS